MYFVRHLVSVSLVLLAPLAPIIRAEPLNIQQVSETLRTQPRTFEENVGQFDPRVRFVLRGSSYQAFVQPDSVVYAWFQRSKPDLADRLGRPSWKRDGAIRMDLKGADPKALVEGMGRTRHYRRNYLSPKYSAPAGLSSTHFEKVVARSVYDGVDVEYYLREGQQLEHDFVVVPEADPSVIRMRFDGIDSLELTPSGDLLLVSGLHTLVQQAPFAYQGSRSDPQQVPASYRLAEDGSVSYALGSYDRSRPLVIDPIAWTTYLGGDGLQVLIDVEAGLFGEADVLTFSLSEDFPITSKGEIVRKGKFEPEYVVTSVDLDLITAVNGGPLRQVVTDAVLDSTAGAQYFDIERVEISPPPDSSTFGQDAIGKVVLLAGTAEKEGRRLDAQLTVLQWGPDGYLVVATDCRGSDVNDVYQFVDATRGTRGGAVHLFATGTVGRVSTNWPNDPSESIIPGGALVHAAYSLEHSNGELTLNLNDTVFWGSDETDIMDDATLYEAPDSDCYMGTAWRRSLSGEHAISRVLFDGNTRKFVGEVQTFPVDVNGRIEEITMQDAASLMLVGSTLDGRISFLRAEGGDRVTLPSEFRSFEFGAAPEEPVKTIPNPARPGEFVQLFVTGQGPSEPRGGGGVPAFGPEVEGDMLMTRRLRLEGDELRIDLERPVGNGTNFQFDFVPGGGYVLGFQTEVDVLDPDAVPVPEPLRGFPDAGSPDVVAVGGLLDFDWRLALVGAGDFRLKPIAPGGIMTAFGQNLAPEGESAGASSLPLPTELHGTRFMMIDADGQQWLMSQFYGDSKQFNLRVPPGAALGLARIEARTAKGDLNIGETRLVKAAPEIFTANGSGSGLPAANLIRVEDGSQSPATKLSDMPIDLGPANHQVYLSLFLTGARNGSSVKVTIKGIPMTTVFGPSPSPEFVGLDQLNVLLERSLIGSGLVDIVVMIDGVTANVVQIIIQ